MKKVVLNTPAILCLLLTLSLISCKMQVKASPSVIHVPTDFPTIQGAINNASSGDTIFVHNGTYYENLVINKSVSLLGEAIGSTIIDGNNTGNVINVTANNVSITGFTIQRSGINLYNSGIHVERFDGVVISQNTMTDNVNGISLYSSSNNVVSGNTILNNYYDGISLYSSSNNVVSGNTILNNYDGISLYSSSNNVVSGNTILNNYYGMYLILYSGNNTIYHNNFNNTNQVLSVTTNIWSYGGEGNYWSDYRGQDLNKDGIGDYPYMIDVSNQDNSPLMGMFYYFIVALKRETYHVTVISNSTISDFRFEIGEETGNKIMHFNVVGENGSVGFCRITIPTELVKYPYIVLVGGEEVVPNLLDISNETYVCLYFTYLHDNYSITIISSEARYLYNELLDRYLKLQMDMVNLSALYYGLLTNYSILLGNYSQLQENHDYLNTSYQQHLLNYSENVRNLQNLVYIFAATTAIFLITTIYLSKRAHASVKTMATEFEDKNSTEL